MTGKEHTNHAGARKGARARPKRKSSAAPPQAAEVVSIYRPGDRVLVEYPPGFYEVVIQRFEIEAGVLWLYGVSQGLALSFPARHVSCRLAPNEGLGWPEAV